MLVPYKLPGQFSMLPGLLKHSLIGFLPIPAVNLVLHPSTGQILQFYICEQIPRFTYLLLKSYKNIFRPKELNDLLALKLAPNVTTSLLERISELHMSHSGLKTSLAELKYLETASKLPLYGLHQFHVKDGEETHIILSVYSGGIMVFEKGKLIKMSNQGYADRSGR